MSVIAMLAILWWGLLGFLSVICGLYFFVSNLGKAGQAILCVLVGLLGQHLLVNYFEADKRAAEGFVSAWAAESADWPDGRVNSQEMHEFLDTNRIRTVSPYLAENWRLRSHSPVEAAGTETIVTEGDYSCVPTKVFTSDVRVHSSEHDMDAKAKLRVWVAKDNDLVVQFKFEGIEFL